MHIFRTAYSCIPGEAKVAAALGNFDGVHVGHQKLLRKVVSQCEAWRARGLESASLALSFRPHPVSVLKDTGPLPFISTLRQRSQWIKDCGVDFFNVIRFTNSFSQIPAEAFIDNILINQARISYLAIGADANVGRGGKGDAGFIRDRMESAGGVVEVVPYEIKNGVRISSGAVRELIRDGRLEEGAAMLGRPFQFEGRVIHGAHRGKVLGFPTINLAPSDQILPPRGVYATKTLLQNGDSRLSATNIGTQPTFDGKELRVETFMLDFNAPVHTGERVEIGFFRKIRGEERFRSAEALTEQIRKDVEEIREFFGQYERR